MRDWFIVPVLAAAFGAAASAHVGSPDVFFQGKAGPYPLLIAIRPPDAIPGVARIEVRALGAGVQKVELTPTPMTGPAAKHPPVADVAVRSAADPRYFEGALWLMSVGAWEVHVRVSGAQGTAELPVPVPAVAIRTAPMEKGVGYFLFGMMLFLTVGLVAIVGAAVRESKLDPGVKPRGWSRSAIGCMSFTAVLLAAALWFGKSWWADDARNYSRKLYKPLMVTASLNAAKRLDLRLTDPGWLALRKLDDIVPDHGKPMHFFLIRLPAMDEFFHLHPEEVAAGYFSTSLPSLPGGTYKMFADVVHESGLAETAIGEVILPDVKGATLTGDDAGGAIPNSGSSIRWVHDPSSAIVAKQVTLFTFEVPDDIEPYMGMGGHAEFVKDDGSVFAHVHPSGSVSMASMAVASREAMMQMHQLQSGRSVSFPYGLPLAGNYHVFVQIRHGGKIDTGAFAVQGR